MGAWTLAVLTLVLAGCTAIPATSSPPSATSAAVATATPIPTPLQTPPLTPPPSPSAEPLPRDLDPMLAKAIRTRYSYGLQFDLDYVRAVAVDPLATNWDYSIPMYEWEFEDVLGRYNESQGLIPALQAYGLSHSDEFGGIYIDETTHAGVVTLWTDHLAEHAAAIRRIAGPAARVAFGEVRYPEAELRRLQDRIGENMEPPWLDEIPAEYQSLGVDIHASQVVLGVSSANPDAPSIIAAQYDLGDRLRVESDGTGAALLPRGTIKGKVVGPDGRRVRRSGLDLFWTSNDPGDCGGGDIGYGVDEDGGFELPCQIGTRTVSIRGEPWKDGAWTEYGRATVQVQAGETIKVTIRLTKLPSVD